MKSVGNTAAPPHVFLTCLLLVTNSLRLTTSQDDNKHDTHGKSATRSTGNTEANEPDEFVNGGWKLPDERPMGWGGPCNIERVDGEGLTQDQFLKMYAYTKPVIIYNWRRNGSFRAMCTKERMLGEWEEEKVVLSSANTYSYTKVEETFGNYVRERLRPQSLGAAGNETFYLFGDIDPARWAPLLEKYVQPKWSLPEHEAALSFGIGSVGTGVPFHFHGPGFAEVIFGSKRWFLLPHAKRPQFDPDKSTLDWYMHAYPLQREADKPIECLLRQNELVYFPDKWWHATLNTETSVFVSTFLSPTGRGSAPPAGPAHNEL